MNPDAMLIVAIELLRKQIADLPLSFAANIGREPTKESPIVGASSDPYKEFFDKFDNPTKNIQPKPATTPQAEEHAGETLISEYIEKLKEKSESNNETETVQSVNIVTPLPVPVVIQTETGKPAPAPEPDRKKEAKESSGGSMIGKVLGMFTGSFASVLGPIMGPLAIFSQVLSSSNSGLSVLQKSIQVLAATLAPILLPIGVALATAILSLADELGNNGEFQNAIQSFTKAMIELIPLFIKLAHVVALVTEALARISGGPKAVKDYFDETKRSEALDAVRDKKTREQYEQEIRRKVGLTQEKDVVEKEVSERLAIYDAQKKVETDAKAGKFSTPDKYTPKGSQYPTGTPQDNAYNDIVSGKSKEDFLKDKVKARDTKGLDQTTIDTIKRIEQTQRDYFGLAYDSAKTQYDKHTSEANELRKKDGLPLLDERQREIAPPKPATDKPVETPKPGESAPATEPGKQSNGLSTAKTITSSTRDAFRDVIKSLQLSIGQPATISNIQSVFNQQQLRALNQDPLEQRLFEIAQKSFQQLEKAANELEDIKNNTSKQPNRAYTPSPVPPTTGK